VHYAPKIPFRIQHMKSEKTERYGVSCTETKNCIDLACCSFKNNEMRLYFRYEFLVYLDMCFTSCVLRTYEYNELKCIYIHIFIYT